MVAGRGETDYSEQVMASNITFEQLIQVEEMNEEWRRGRHTLVATDRGSTRPDRLPTLSKRELLEAQAEIELEGTPEFSTDKLAEELLDAMVFWIAFKKISGVEVDYQQVVPLANGQASDSNYWDRTGEVLENMADGDIAQNLTYGLVLLVSGFNHLPEKRDLVSVGRQVIEKNSANRPPEFYTLEDENGNPLSEEEAHAKYYHFEEGAKDILRSHYKTRLRPWQYQPHKQELLGFRDSVANLQRMRDSLPEVNAKIKAEVLEHLVRPANAPLQRDELLEKLPVAGAKLVSGTEYVLYQNQKPA